MIIALLRRVAVGTLLAAATLLVAPLPAQCFQQDFGVLLGHGDDDPLYPIQALGFAFPFAGATYTDVHVSNNGVVYLSNAGAPVPGTPTGYSTAPGILVANLLGNGPTIAAYWKDLDNLPANEGGVFVDTAQPGRCTITWQHTVEYLTAIRRTIQIQLLQSGDVCFFYSRDFDVLGGLGLCGLAPGSAIADPGPSDLSAGGSSTSAAVYELFDATNRPFDLGGHTVRFVPNGGGFTVAADPCDPATHEVFGIGCGADRRAFYEEFDLARPIDLAGKTIRAIENSAGGYDVTVSPLTTFVMPTTPGLAMEDDEIFVGVGFGVIPGFTWEYPGGSLSFLLIDSNGRLLLNGQSGAGLPDFTPTVDELINGQLHLLCVPHCDFAPDGATNVDNVFFETDNVSECRITWRNVPCFQSSQRSTFQVVLFHTPGPGGDGFELRYQSIVNDSAFDPTAIVGFATAPGARDPGARDLSASLPFATAIDQFDDLALRASPAPVLGNLVTFTASNLRPGFAANVLGFADLPTGVALGPLAPSCSVYLQLLGNELVFGLVPGPMATHALLIPMSPVFAGLDYTCQTVNFTSGLNPLGLITSNALEGRVRNL